MPAQIVRTLLAVSVTLLFSLQTHAAVFKIATLSPDGSSWMVTMKQAAKKIAEETDKRVKFKFYPGGVMGNDQTVFRKIRARQLHGAATTGGALSAYYKDAQLYGLPLIFKNQQAIDYIRARMDKTITDGLEKKGFVSFGLADGGMAYVMSQSPISSVEQLGKTKAWVPNDDKALLETAQSFGIHPVPLGLGDVLTSLQSGLVDTVATSPIAAIALQWHTQVKYITNVPMVYLYAMLAIDKKAFYKLSAADQAIVRKHMTAAFETIDQQNQKDNANALQALLNQGLEMVQPNATEMAQWNKLAEHARQQAINNGQVSQAGVDKINAYLEELEAQTASAE